ncbi:hypothetical protein ACH4E8_33545 [Streptomyces sp. NPDC017979]|uniref:hypothetical protein n=1 Tax=Streptomyces sp. NPDC017979 TaxID=3365024 RepID=UPI0037A8031B
MSRWGRFFAVELMGGLCPLLAPSSAVAATGMVTVTQLDASGTVLGIETLEFFLNGGCVPTPTASGQQQTNIANNTTRVVRIYARPNCAGPFAEVPAVVGSFHSGSVIRSVFVPSGL